MPRKLSGAAHPPPALNGNGRVRNGNGHGAQPNGSNGAGLPPVPDPPTRRRLRRPWLWALAVLGAILVLLLSLEAAYGRSILPGVNVQGVAVGSLSPAAADKVVERRLGEYAEMPLLIRYGERSWQTTPAELGVTFDVGATTARAYQVGKELNPLSRFGGQFLGLIGQVDVRPAYSLDGQSWREMTDSLAAQIDIPYRDAAVSLEGGQFRVTNATPGLVVDREALAQRLRDRLDRLSAEPIEVPVKEAPPQVSAADIDALREPLAAATARPILLTFAERSLSYESGVLKQKQVDRGWTLDSARLAALVTVRQVDGKATIAIDRERARKLAAEIAPQVEQEARDAKLAFTSSGIYPLQISQPRRTLDVDAFVAELEQALASGDANRTLALPVVEQKATVAVEDIDRMGLRELIYTTTVGYANSTADRAHNLALGAELLTGTVLAPGQLFSFNATVGNTTAERGFKLGYAILNNQTSPDYGGGICQVSTALFQAVLQAGLQIEERHPHAYRIKNYETAGLIGADATVYYPYVDFRFRNNTDHYVLIQASAEGGRVTVSLYGTKPGWKVSFDAQEDNVKRADKKEVKQGTDQLPKGVEIQVESPEDGADILLTRTVTRANGEATRYLAWSRYRPQGNVKLIGTGQSGAGAPSSSSGSGASRGGGNGENPRATNTSSSPPKPRG